MYPSMDVYHITLESTWQLEKNTYSTEYSVLYEQYIYTLGI